MKPVREFRSHEINYFWKNVLFNYSVQRIKDYMLPILNLHNSEEDFLLMFVPEPIRIYHENEISTKN